MGSQPAASSFLRSMLLLLLLPLFHAAAASGTIADAAASNRSADETAAVQRSSSAAVRSLQAVGAQAKVGIYYYPKCSHCLNFLKTQLLPVMHGQGGLPPSSVQLSVLMVANPLYSQVYGPPDTCGVAQLCALKTAFPMPTALNSPEMIKAVTFVVCMLEQEGIAGCSDAGIQQCANQAGLPWPDMQTCSTSADKGNSIMVSPTYKADPMANGQSPPDGPVPWFVVNGKLLSGVDRDIPFFVCQQLRPMPASCPPDAGAAPGAAPAALTTLAPQAAQQAAVAQHQACENCWEVGDFRWPGAGTAKAPSWSGPLGLPRLAVVAATAVAVAASLVAAAVAVVRRQGRRERGSTRALECEEEMLEAQALQPDAVVATAAQPQSRAIVE